MQTPPLCGVNTQFTLCIYDIVVVCVCVCVCVPAENNIQADGATKLAEALKSNKALVYLNLECT